MAEAKSLFCEIAAEQLHARFLSGNIEREEYENELEKLADFILED